MTPGAYIVDLKVWQRDGQAAAGRCDTDEEGKKWTGDGDASGRLAGDIVSVDYAKIAEAMGCAAFEAETVDEFTRALAAARAEHRPCVIAVRIDARGLEADPQAWWDAGVPHTSTRAETRERAQDYLEGARAQRLYH